MNKLTRISLILAFCGVVVAWPGPEVVEARSDASCNPFQDWDKKLRLINRSWPHHQAVGAPPPRDGLLFVWRKRRFLGQEVAPVYSNGHTHHAPLWQYTIESLEHVACR